MELPPTQPVDRASSLPFHVMILEVSIHRRTDRRIERAEAIEQLEAFQLVLHAILPSGGALVVGAENFFAITPLIAQGFQAVCHDAPYVAQNCAKSFHSRAQQFRKWSGEES